MTLPILNFNIIGVLMSTYKIYPAGDNYLVVEKNEKILMSTVYEHKADELLKKLVNGCAFKGHTPDFMTLGKVSQIS